MQTNKKLINLIEARSEIIGDDENTADNLNFTSIDLNKNIKEPITDLDSNASKSKSSRKHEEHPHRLDVNENLCKKPKSKTRESKRIQKLSIEKLEFNEKKENLVGMVRDMATFKWPDIHSEDKQKQQPSSELIMLNRDVKQIKFESKIYFLKAWKI